MLLLFMFVYCAKKKTKAISTTATATITVPLDDMKSIFELVDALKLDQDSTSKDTELFAKSYYYYINSFKQRSTFTNLKKDILNVFENKWTETLLSSLSPNLSTFVELVLTMDSVEGDKGDSKILLEDKSAITQMFSSYTKNQKDAMRVFITSCLRVKIRHDNCDITKKIDFVAYYFDTTTIRLIKYELMNWIISISSTKDLKVVCRELLIGFLFYEATLQLMFDFLISPEEINVLFNAIDTCVSGTDLDLRATTVMQIELVEMYQNLKFKSVEEESIIYAANIFKLCISNDNLRVPLLESPNSQVVVFLQHFFIQVFQAINEQSEVIHINKPKRLILAQPFKSISTLFENYILDKEFILVCKALNEKKANTESYYDIAEQLQSIIQENNMNKVNLRVNWIEMIINTFTTRKLQQFARYGLYILNKYK